ncbi:MAG: peptidoglycan DD-metalloendopeptidase family protein, partial [Caldilineaceae bacterium]|nr:peptidoglycan DD-metalloendopeptidase family protein [Caldilineaceae bacterium]
PHRRQAREIFFRQLNQALLDDPNLWVVLTLREDYVAALDPYAHLMADKLRARFYMERMGVDAAQAAVTQPAALAGRPFAEGVAEALVDNLRRVKALGQVEEQLGQYIEPVQLQVVCYQLWAKVIGHNANAATITLTDLQQSGDVNTALADFYNQALATVLASFSISERQLRTWFDHKLITEAGTRGTVYQGLTETEGMPNPLVKLLIDQFLIRTEQRAGGYWVELVHDRFVEPIRRANRDWFQTRQHPLTRAAHNWHDAEANNNLLLQGKQLQLAQRQLESDPGEFGDLERAFVQASLDAAQIQRQRRQRLLIGAGALLIFVLTGFVMWALSSAAFAREQQAIAVTERSIAVAALTVQSEVVKTSDARLQVAEATLVQAQRRSEDLANNLSIVLTAQLVPTATPLSTPTPLLQSTSTTAPNPGATATVSAIPPSPTPTVNLFATATFDAIQQDLAQIRVTQTSVAVTASASTVRVGSVQKVTTWVNVRNTPGYINKVSDDVIGQMVPDTPVIVVGGPATADSITWWQIQGVSGDSTRITGWIAEAISGEVLLASFPVSTPSLSKPFDGDYPITLYFGEYPEFYSQFTYDGVPLKGSNALNFGLPEGTAVKATDEGTVLRVDSEPSGFGNFILLQHEWGESLYTQLERMDVTVGERVLRGQLIGLSGNSGASTGPHLRFGIRI